MKLTINYLEEIIMSKLQHKIDAKKKAINDSKANLKADLELITKKLSARSGLSLGALGGLAIGFLLFPRKKALIRYALKYYTAAATVKQLFDLLPGSRAHKRTTKRLR